MHPLLLGRRSMLAAAMARYFTDSNIPFDWLSYQEIEAQKDLDLSKYSHIFNCIAYTNVDLAENEPDQAQAINVDFVRWIGENALRAGAKLIHFSTDYVFDGNSSLVYNEEAIAAPLGVYGKTKLDGERALLELYPKAVVVRTAWLYGLGKSHFVRAILDRMMQSRELQVVEDQVGTSTYAADLAEASVALADASGLFHFANQGVKSRYEWALAIQDCAIEMGLPLKVKEIIPVTSDVFKTAAKRPAYSPLSTKKYSEYTQQSPRCYREALTDYLMMAQQEGELC